MNKHLRLLCLILVIAMTIMSFASCDVINGIISGEGPGGDNGDNGDNGGRR